VQFAGYETTAIAELCLVSVDGLVQAMNNFEVRCESCGTINRVPRYSVRRIANCGKCHQSLPEPQYILRLRRLYSLRRFARFWWIPAFVAFWCWVLWDQLVIGLDCTLFPSKQPTPGLYARYTNASGSVPLKIQSSAGTNYFVKFENPRTSSTVVAFFVRGGIPVSAYMPVGEFVMKSASGHSPLTGRRTARGPPAVRDGASYHQKDGADGDQKTRSWFLSRSQLDL